VIGEAKTPTRSAVTWFDGAYQVNEVYEKEVPAMFVPNVFSFATEGRCLRYGSIRMPIDLWGPWRDEEHQEEGNLGHVRTTVESLMRPGVVLDILQNFTLFATDKKHRRIKVICRYQQYETTNKMVARVVAGYPRKGLIWHFQGSGKSLLMVFAAQKLRMHPRLGNPTVVIVVDRIDLDTQISATFNAADVPNMIGVASRVELQRLINQDVRKVLITTIHKFGSTEEEGTTNSTKSTNVRPQKDSEDSCQFVPFVVKKSGAWNERKNIIVMVDEAHRTQEGDLGRKMREALPNAFLFGLTGTPINRADRNTFWAFGADEDSAGYLSRYSFQDSIRDKATLPLHFEAPAVKLRIDKAAIDEAFKQITDNMSEQDRDDLAKRAAKMAVLVKNPGRVRAVVEHIVQHYRTKVEPNGFKAQVVCFDRECCVLYKAVMDEIIGPEASAIVMSGGQKDPASWSVHLRDKDAEEKLLDRFRDPADPLKFVIVTSKLLTGFDAPILQAMYLDKPMKDHNLLQAICRVNRTYGQTKTHGLIVDYIGIFDDVALALDFDEKAVQQVVSNIDELRKALPEQMLKCLGFFSGVDRSVGGYEGLMAAQQLLPDNATRDKFAAEYCVLGTIWEALSPDPCLGAYATDYKWLTQVYESVKPVSGNGKLLWHRLGAKTVELINENVHVEAVRDDIEALVLDADALDSILHDANPAKKAREVEIKLIARLRKHAGNPKFKELGERLEKIREKHEQGLLNSLELLKAILEVAKETVEAEKHVEPEAEEDRALAALTELFNEVKSKQTHVIVERIVADIDGIVRQVRFPDWQNTSGGQREVQKALRSALGKYKLHTDQDLFEKAYGYIREYY
jgi:type I restriction enzyme R subunit